MLDERRGNINHSVITPVAVVLGHPPVRRVDVRKLHAKRITCKTCDGKACVGRCKFEKIH